jgi:hypothetical protein
VLGSVFNKSSRKAVKLSKIFKLSYLLRIGRLVKYMVGRDRPLRLLEMFCSLSCCVLAEKLFQIPPHHGLCHCARVPDTLGHMVFDCCLLAVSRSHSWLCSVWFLLETANNEYRFNLAETGVMSVGE